MTENVTEQHRALKAVVISLGVLIVICLGVIATTVARRMAAPSHDEPIPPPVIEQSGHPVFFGDVPVVIPSGSKVIQMSVSSDRLLLLLEDTAGARRILVADSATGNYLGSYRLMPGDREAP